MLDTKWVREHYDELAEMLASRNNAFPLDRYRELDEERRRVLLEVEKLKERRNAGSKEVGIKKKAGEDTEALQNEIRELGEEIKKFDDKANEIESELDELALRIPNRPHASCGRRQRRERQYRDAPLGHLRFNLTSSRSPTGISARRWGSWTSTAA